MLTAFAAVDLHDKAAPEKHQASQNKAVNACLGRPTAQEAPTRLRTRTLLERRCLPHTLSFHRLARSPCESVCHLPDSSRLRYTIEKSTRGLPGNILLAMVLVQPNYASTRPVKKAF